MLQKLLDFEPLAVRRGLVAVLLASSLGALGQGIADTQPVPATAQPPTTQLAAAPPSKVDSSSFDISHMALAASLLSLLGVGFLILNSPKHRPQAGLRTAGIDMTPATKQFNDDQTRQIEAIVNRVLRQQGGAPAASVPRPAQNQPKPAANVPKIKTASTALPPPEPAAPAQPLAAPAVAAMPAPPVAPEAPAEPTGPTEAPEAVPAPAPTGPRRAYVSSAPVNGRFRRNALQSQPAHNSIYEITWDPAQPDQTTFQVNPAQASHPRHISSYADVLEPACEFNLPQGAATRIVTETPGLLRRVDGDDWEIVRKARIYFA